MSKPQPMGPLRNNSDVVELGASSLVHRGLSSLFTGEPQEDDVILHSVVKVSSNE
jgi:hypothetical protein